MPSITGPGSELAYVTDSSLALCGDGSAPRPALHAERAGPYRVVLRSPRGEYPHLEKFRDADELERELDQRREHYNTVRLHEGIGYVTARRRALRPRRSDPGRPSGSGGEPTRHPRHQSKGA